MSKINVKRHCMIVHHNYPLAEPRVEREAQALLRFGYEVDVICLQQTDDELPFEVVEGANVHRLPVRRDKRRGIAGQFLEYLSFFFLAFLKVNSLYNKRKYGVVEVHNLPDFLVFAAIWPKLRGARLILNIHDVMPEFYAARFKTGMNSWQVRLVRWQEWISCRFADHVITVTELWREALIARGVRADKTSVVMNLPDERIFGNGHSATPPAPPQDGFRLIYHGAITQRYGLDLLIQAVDMVKARVPGIHLTLHGGGEFRDELMRMVEERKLQEYVHFSINKVPSSELPRMIQRAHAGVVPYRRDVFTDGILPTKLMEYAAMQIPVIAARTTVIEKYFNEDMVQFIPAEDVNALAEAIVHLYQHPERRSQLVAGCNRFTERYSWEKISRQYHHTVEQLTAG